MTTAPCIPWWVCLAIPLIIGLAGCGGSTPPAISSTVDGDWQLVAGQVDGSDLELQGPHRITMGIDGDEVGGVSACNSYGGEVRVDGEQIDFGQLWVTEMACSPPTIMELETTYLTALQRVDHVTGDEDLVLTGPGVELRYEEVPPVPAAELVGTEWVLDSIVSGTEPDAGVSSTGGEPATLLLTDDGSLRGSTGCRDLSGRYMTSGDEVVVTELSAEGDCPPELETQDDHVVAVLGDGFRVDIDGGQLTLTSRDGAGLIYLAEE